MNNLEPTIYLFVMFGIPTIGGMKILLKYLSVQKKELAILSDTKSKGKIKMKIGLTISGILYGACVLLLIFYYGLSGFMSFDFVFPIWVLFALLIVFVPYFGLIYGLSMGMGYALSSTGASSGKILSAFLGTLKHESEENINKIK